MKIVVDAGNGGGFLQITSSHLSVQISVAAVSLTQMELSKTISQTLRIKREAMESICRQVCETGADLGIIFDTDVDRR